MYSSIPKGNNVHISLNRLDSSTNAEIRAFARLLASLRFEVGHEVRETFVKADRAANSRFKMNARGRWQADLVGLAQLRLASIGVSDMAGGNWCTHEDRERFYSHLRDGKGGRMAALIWRDVARPGEG